MANGLALGIATAYLNFDITDFERNIDEAEADLSGLERSTGSAASGFKSVGSTLQSVGGALTNHVTKPLAAVGIATIKTGSDFEFAMSQVKKTIPKEEDFKFEELTQKAREMGRETTFTAGEAANALQYMGMAGWNADQMMAGLPAVLQLSVAGGSELATTSDIVTDALTAFGKEAGDAGRLADILAAASMNSNTNVTMMGESFKYVAPIAGALKFSMEDVALALGLMANAGIKSSMAGTSLRSVMSNLSNPVGQAAKAVEALEIEITNADGSTRDFRSIMDELRAKLGGATMPTEELTARLAYLDEQFALGAITEEEYGNQTEALAYSAYTATDAQKVQYAAMLAGKTGMSGLLAIVNAGQDDYNELAKEIDGSSEAFDGMGASAKMAEIAQDNFQSRVKILISKLADLGIQIFNLIEEPLTKLIEWLGKVVDWFSGLDDGVKSTIVQFLLVVAAIGPVISAIGGLIKGVGTAIEVFGVLKSGVSVVAGLFGAGEGGLGLLGVLKTLGSFLIGPLKAAFGAIAGVIGGIPAIVIAVVAAVGGGLVLLYKHNEGFREFVDNMAGKIKDFVKGIPEMLGNFWEWFTGSLGKAKDKIVEWGGEIKKHAGDAGEGFKEGIKLGILGVPVFIGTKLFEVLQKTGKFKEDMGKEGEEASEKFKKGIDSIDEIGSKIAKALGKGLAMVVGWRQDMIKEAEETSKEYVKKTEEGMQPLEPKTRAQLNVVKEIAKKHGVEMEEVAKNTGGKYTEEYEEEMKKVKEKTKENLDDTMEVAEEFEEDMAEEGKETGEGYVEETDKAIGQLEPKTEEQLLIVQNIAERHGATMEEVAKNTGGKYTEEFEAELAKTKDQTQENLDDTLDVAEEFKRDFAEEGRQSGELHNESLLSSIEGLDTGVQQQYEKAMQATESFGNRLEAKSTYMADKFVEKFMVSMNKLTQQMMDLFRNIINSLIPMGGTMTPVGQNFMQGFMNGIRQVGDQIIAYVNNLVTHIAQAALSAKQNMNAISPAATNPRAVGVDYVPYNGYGATLHEGEMVLTKEEAERYRKGLDRNGTGGNGDTFIFNSPKAVDEREAARLLKETKRRLALGF